MENKIEIFISYAWKDAHESIDQSREQIVDEICNSFASKGYEIIRDKNHLTYKQSIKMFMERIGQGNYIIAVVSDKYLKSEYCMYEAYQMFQSRHFRERVFPVVLGDANIFSIEGQTDYLVFWGNRLNELKQQAERLKEINQTLTVPLIERRREIELMSYSIAEFMATVADMNVLSPELHARSGFEVLIKAIEAKIKAEQPSSKPIPEIRIRKEVFISYAWGGKSEEIVNEIDSELQAKGIQVLRDKRDLGYKGGINKFMEPTSQGKSFIVVISDKYLKSVNCMSEFTTIVQNRQFHDRVFPIILEDADIYDPVSRLEYVKFWEQRIQDLDEAMRSLDSANLQGIREEIDVYDTTRNTISRLTSVLKDMNTLSITKDSKSNLRYLLNAITNLD